MSSSALSSSKAHRSSSSSSRSTYSSRSASASTSSSTSSSSSRHKHSTNHHGESETTSRSPNVRSSTRALTSSSSSSSPHHIHHTLTNANGHSHSQINHPNVDIVRVDIPTHHSSSSSSTSLSSTSSLISPSSINSSPSSSSIVLPASYLTFLQSVPLSFRPIFLPTTTCSHAIWLSVITFVTCFIFFTSSSLLPCLTNNQLDRELLWQPIVSTSTTDTQQQTQQQTPVVAASHTTHTLSDPFGDTHTQKTSSPSSSSLPASSASSQSHIDSSKSPSSPLSLHSPRPPPPLSRNLSSILNVAQPGVEYLSPLIFDLLSDAPGDIHYGDSSGTSYILRGTYGGNIFHYHLCSFRHVCVSPQGIFLRFHNFTTWKYWRKDLATRCNAQRQRELQRQREASRSEEENKQRTGVFSQSFEDICSCFHDGMRPLVLPYEYKIDGFDPFDPVDDFPSNGPTFPSVSTNHEHDHQHKERSAQAFFQSFPPRAYSDPFQHVAALQHSHFWAIHKWVNVHHIAHWMQKLMLFRSIFRHTPALAEFLSPQGLPQGIIFQDTDEKITRHELEILRLVINDTLNTPHPLRNEAHWNKYLYWTEQLSAGMYRTDGQRKVNEPFGVYPQHLILSKTDTSASTSAAASSSVPSSVPSSSSSSSPLPPVPPYSTCFDRVTWSPTYAIFSTSSADTVSFRRRAHHHYGFSAALSQSRCAPKRAILLYRHNRGILNNQDIVTWFTNTYKLNLELVTIDEKTPSREQAALFASSGLILSAHSSQLSNLIFAPSSACVIEIAPEFWNGEFISYARGLGIKYNYALGGLIENETLIPPHKECVALLEQLCDGDGLCIMEENWRCAFRHGTNKRKNFYADLEQVKKQVKKCVNHLNWQCYGRWASTQYGPA